MGNVCSGQDQFNTESYGRTMQPNQEIFEVGRVPQLTQNPAYFNDDDPIDRQLNNGPIRYSTAAVKVPMSRQQYNLQANTSLKVQAVGIPNNANLALMVTVETKELQYKKADGSLCDRDGIDIICVIDHSGSMAGDKEQIARSTLKYMLQFLGNNDRVCLIMFDCQVYRLTRLMRVSQDNIPKFKIAINAINPKGGTDIGNAMRMALSVLKHRKHKNPVTAIFLLSDGEDPNASDTVRNDLNIYNIRDPFTIKTFGFGRDVCPRIMAEIAHMKEGQFYFIPDLQNIDVCFVEALGGLISVVANNMQLNINAVGSHIQLQKAYGDKWQYDQFRGIYTMYQPHVLSGIRKDYVFEVRMPTNPNDQHQLHIRLQMDPLDGSPPVILEETVQITNSQQNKEVMENYYRVKGAECLNQAQQLAENGQYNNAQNLLLQMQQQVQLQNFHDPNMDMLTADLQFCANQCNPGQYQTGGRHNMTQLEVVHMYQKPRGVDILTTQNGQQVQIQCAYQNNIQRDYKQQVVQYHQNNPNYQQQQ